MRYQLPSGRVVQSDQAFELAGMQYPSGVRSLTPAERAEREIVEIVDAPRADDRFYWDGDLARPKDLAPLKAIAIAQVKAAAASLLLPTDWKVIRSIEGGAAVDAATETFRAAVRAHSNALEAEIAAIATVVDIAAWSQHDWPVLAE